MPQIVMKLENLFERSSLPKRGTHSTGPGPTAVEQSRVHTANTMPRSMHQMPAHEPEQAQGEFGWHRSPLPGPLQELGSGR